LTFRGFGWFAGVEKKALTLGGYSIADLENVCVVERKNLSDLVRSLTTDHANFVSRLKRMSAYPHKLLVITAALSSVKSTYPFSRCNPNQVMQALIAVLVTERRNRPEPVLLVEVRRSRNQL